ncbi:MAG: hypothetical protein Q8M01_06720 [Rubrivivax sp.]|nr:hypothetical protein [Rubrivivax sp.]
MKLSLKKLKPRNPLVAPSLRRKAGSHRPSGGASRQQAGAALRREVERLRPSP